MVAVLCSHSWSAIRAGPLLWVIVSSDGHQRISGGHLSNSDGLSLCAGACKVVKLLIRGSKLIWMDVAGMKS